MAEQWRISGGHNDDEANDTDNDAEPTYVALVDSSAGSKVKCFNRIQGKSVSLKNSRALLLSSSCILRRN